MKTLAVLLGIILLGLGAYFFTMGGKVIAPAGVAGTDNQATTTPSDEGVEGAPVSAYTVRYTPNGFSPATMTVPLGTTVTFIDETGAGMWVGSDEHPSHTGYDGTSRSEHCAAGATPSFDQCARSSSYEFTFAKAGTFDYHNHVNAQHHGSIVVE